MMIRILAAFAAAAVAAAAPALAQDITSQYSTTAVKKCEQVGRAPQGEGEWSIWLCAGIGGQVVRLTEDDLRMTISIGRDLAEAADAPVSKHQFPGFNTVGDTLEWRLFQGQPFATIHRRTLADVSGPGKPVQYGMLIVTRLNPACHVAYVDVRANKEPNVLARQAADQNARNFDCNNNPTVVGNRGRAIQLATP